MPTRHSTIFATAALLAACSSAGDQEPVSDEGALSAAQSEDFRELLRCDGAVLDRGTKSHSVTALDEHGVSEKNAYALQFVVRDQTVVAKLAGRVDHIRNEKGEIILSSLIDEGQTFDFFEDWSFAPMSSRPDGRQTRIRQQVGAVVHTVHGEPGKVRVVFNQTTFTDRCDTYFEETHCAARDRQLVPIRTERKDEPIIDHVFSCSTS